MENLKNMLLTASKKKAGSFNNYFKNELDNRIKEKINATLDNLKEIKNLKEEKRTAKDYEEYAIKNKFDKYLKSNDCSDAAMYQMSFEEFEKMVIPAKKFKEKNKRTFADYVAYAKNNNIYKYLEVESFANAEKNQVEFSELDKWANIVKQERIGHTIGSKSKSYK